MSAYRSYANAGKHGHIKPTGGAIRYGAIVRKPSANGKGKKASKPAKGKGKKAGKKAGKGKTAQPATETVTA